MRFHIPEKWSLYWNISMGETRAVEKEEFINIGDQFHIQILWRYVTLLWHGQNCVLVTSLDTKLELNVFSTDLCYELLKRVTWIPYIASSSTKQTATRRNLARMMETCRVYHIQLSARVASQALELHDSCSTRRHHWSYMIAAALGGIIGATW